MPALVYLFAGHSTAARSSIGTLVAFTTLQTRLFFPVGSLLGVGVDVQTSLALFDRIFEYLDLPVDIDEPGDAGRCARPRGDVRFRRRLVPLRTPTAPGRSRTCRSTVPAGHEDGDRRRDRRGKTTLGYLVARLYDAERGAVPIDGVDVRDLTLRRRSRRRSASSRRRPTCSTPPSARTSASRGPDATDEEIEDAARAARIHD